MSRWKKALDLETKVAMIIHQQEKNGIGFDLPKAIGHLEQLDRRQDQLYKEMRPYLTTEVYRKYTVEVKAPFLAKGGLSKATKDWFGEDLPDIGGPFSRVEFVDPDIGSRQKLIKQLLNQGWKPVIFTDSGQPKLTEKGTPVDTLNDIEAPVGKLLAEWYVLNHRKSQIKGWVDRIRPDGRMTAGANSCGTNTARMRHRGVVNVPKAAPSVVFGYEMRDLFIPREGYKMVGHDASGLEARMMAHYTYPLDDGEFAEEILHGDIHNKNASAFFNVETTHKDFPRYRDLAKTLFYGLIYGAQVGKVQSIIGGSRREAQEVFDAFWSINPGLGKLRKKIIALADKHGWIPGLDGRKIYIRSSHSALNALFQSGGAIVMKASMVILDHWVKTSGINAIKVADMHDEAEAEIPIKDIVLMTGTVEDLKAMQSEYKGKILTPIMNRHDGTYQRGYTPYGEFAVKSIRKAGKVLNLRCDLDAEYMIGNSWAEVH